tara:strand:+ start:32 stop:676 length:645 start_codon:yes stop_codon:yes gene_type:complete
MKYLMMSVIIFLGTTLLLFIFDRAAEYTSYPFSGHPNYVEPSSFPVFEVDLENVTYLEDIDSWSAVGICASLEEGSVLVLSSDGGSMSAGWAMMGCIKDRDITIAVAKANSMATAVMLAGSKVCMFAGAELGFHMPSISVIGKRRPLNPIHLDDVLSKAASHIRGLGYGEAKISYLERFMRLSTSGSKLAAMPQGTMAGILGNRFVGTCIEKEV